MRNSISTKLFWSFVVGLLVTLGMSEGAMAQYIPRSTATIEREKQEREERERARAEEMEKIRADAAELREGMERMRNELRVKEEIIQDQRRELEAMLGQLREHRQVAETHRETEMNGSRLARIHTMGKMAEDTNLSAAFALDQLIRIVPDVEARREVLGDLLDGSRNLGVQRLIRMHLISLPLPDDGQEEAVEILQGLLP